VATLGEGRRVKARKRKPGGRSPEPKAQANPKAHGNPKAQPVPKAQGTQKAQGTPKTQAVRKAQAAQAGGGAEALPARKWWPVEALRRWPQMAEFFQLGAQLSPDTINSEEPICKMLKEVMAEIVASFGTCPYALHEKLGLSKEFVRQLASQLTNASLDTVVKVCRPAGFAGIEALVEAFARCLSGGREKRPQ
jgi:hypothetical protein